MLLRYKKLGWKCDNNSKGQEESSPITRETKGEQIISFNPAELTRELTGTLMTDRVPDLHTRVSNPRWS
jgi:hypothetical protein